jgi:hypothetical protein
MATKKERKILQSSATAKQAFRDMAQKAGFEMIGFDISWELVVGSEAVISRKAIEKIYSVNGLNPYYLPTEIEAAPAFRKAVRNINSRMKDKEGDSKVTHKLIKLDDRSDALVYAVVDQEIDKANEDVDHLYSTKIVFDKDTGQVKFYKGKVSSKYGSPHPIAVKVKALYEEYSDQYIGWDLMRCLTRNVIGSRYMNGIRLMRQAGRYFVPFSKEAEAVLKAHEAVISALGEGCNFYCEDKFSTPDHIKRVAAGARDTFKQTLKELMEEIDNFKCKSPRKGTLENRMKEYKSLRNKVRYYSDLLGVKLEKVQEGIKDCEAYVKASLDGGRWKGAKSDKEEKKVTRKVEEKKVTRKVKNKPEAEVTATTTKGGTKVTVKEVVSAEDAGKKEDAGKLPSFVGKTTKRKKTKKAKK